MVHAATECGNFSPDRMFDHPDQSNSVEWVLHYGFQAVQKRTEGTMAMLCEREEAMRARGPETLQCT